MERDFIFNEKRSRILLQEISEFRLDEGREREHKARAKL